MIAPQDEYNFLKDKLQNNEFLKVPKNNEYLCAFLEAKKRGGYKRIIYNKPCSYKTLVKKARNVVKVEEYFNKDFSEINEDDLLQYRDLLNDDKIFKSKTLVKWKETNKINSKTGNPIKKPYFEIEKTDKPLSHRTKEDYKENFCEFYRFIIEYERQNKGKQLNDITSFFRLRRPSDFQEIKVEWINDQEREKLLMNIRNEDFKALVQLSIMSGARPSEIIKVRYGQANNLYKNNKNKWVIHLPKIKAVSYKKYPFIIDLYEDELTSYFENKHFKEGDLVFKTTEQTFRKLMKHYSTKYLGKAYSPKILRKTARMIRSNAGYSTDWINKLMGHAPGTNVTAHYVNYEGITQENSANERLKGREFPSIKQHYEDLKLKTQAQEEHMKKMQEQIDIMLKERIQSKI